MSIIATVLYWALQVFFYAMIGRLILDLMLSINPNFRPKGLLLPLAEIVMTITDPPLRFVRRFIKPVRMGAMALDFGWTLLILVTVFVQGIVRGFI